MPSIEKTCPTCGKKFRDSKHPDKIHCSASCLPRITHTEKICPTCGKCFLDKKHPNKIYCSYQCSLAPHYKTATCAGCGREFTATLKKLKTRKYCTRECAYKHMERPSADPTKRNSRQCQQCGKEFETWAYRTTKYCSRTCQNAAKSMPNSYTTKDCEICGNPYTVQNFFVQKRKSRFCSKECQGAATSKRMRGTDNHNYRGGAIQYRGANWGRQRRKALQRDGYQCQICKRRKKPDERKIVDVHHIIPYRDFNGDYKTANNLGNLITLCKKCHAKVEFGKIACPIPLL